MQGCPTASIFLPAAACAGFHIVISRAALLFFFVPREARSANSRRLIQLGFRRVSAQRNPARESPLAWLTSLENAESCRES